MAWRGPAPATSERGEGAESRERVEGHELGELEPGTRQRTQLRFRLTDIAWTALCTVLLLWTVAGVVGAARGTTGWAYSVVACVLLVVTVALRVMTFRRRSTSLRDTDARGR
ncbi:hypothetical protein [Streptomyces sp. NPDC127072]|uniref:hypothetical protein n=1 Tax=Streptomyces sp. NPDC127072 TaxID=3347129 RepID=UPI0036507D26